MQARRDLICSSLTAAITGVIMAVFPDRPVDIPVGVALVVALAVLARSAIRLGANPIPHQPTSTGPTQD